MNLRRISLAAALALALPVLASAQSRTSAPRAASAGSGLGVGVLLGMEAFDGNTGFALRADGVMDSKWIAPKVLLSGVMSVGYTRFSDGYSNYDAFTGARVDYDWSENIIKFVPAARFTFDVAPQFGLYADAGIGLYFATYNQTQRSNVYGIPNQDYDNSAFGVAMRLGGGAFFKVADGVRLGGEIALNPYFGDYADSSFSLMALAQFRL